MGKGTWRGPVPKDHPMFSGGPEMFSLLAFNASESNSVSATTGAPLEKSTSVTEDENRAGKQMMLGRAVQNVQMAMRAKGKPLGAISAKTILEMVDRGEIEDSDSIRYIRKLAAD